MGGGQDPGPIWNIFGRQVIDDGTSCRLRTPDPAPVGMARHEIDPTIEPDIHRRVSTDLPDYALMVTTCLPLLSDVRTVSARFHRPRRARTVIDEIVIHDTDSTTTEYENTLRYLANPQDGRKVSIHYLIGREQGQIVAMVPEDHRANQAPYHNERSIGIELWRHHGDDNDFTDWQYQVLSQLVYDLMQRYGIRRTRIVGHGFFQRDRRGEPHGFDWARLDDLLDDINRRVKGFDPKYAAF
jgi:hypothetical protein